MRTALLLLGLSQIRSLTDRVRWCFSKAIPKNKSLDTRRALTTEFCPSKNFRPTIRILSFSPRSTTNPLGSFRRARSSMMPSMLDWLRLRFCFLFNMTLIGCPLFSAQEGVQFHGRGVAVPFGKPGCDADVTAEYGLACRYPLRDGFWQFTRLSRVRVGLRNTCEHAWRNHSLRISQRCRSLKPC